MSALHTRRPRAQIDQIHLEVIAHCVQGLGLCSPCEMVLAAAGAESEAGGALGEYPREWQDEVRRLSDWVHDLARRYGRQIRIRVVDPQSPAGLIRSVRHRIRRYPTWIVNGQTRVVGWNREALEAAIGRECYGEPARA